MIGDIPENAMLSILMLMDFKSIQRMKVTSKSWLGLISSHQGFWRCKYEHDFGECEGGDVNFEKEYKIEYGWRLKEPRVVDLEGHQGHVADVKIYGSKMASISDDASVRVWDLTSMECIHHFPIEHEYDGVSAVALNGEKVVGGTWTGYVYVWELVSGDLCFSCQAYDTSLCDMVISGNELVTARQDEQVQVWDLFDYDVFEEFAVGGVTCINVKDDTIVVGSWKNEVHFLNRTDGTSETLEANDWVACVCANSKHVFASYAGGDHVDVWERESRQHVESLVCEVGGSVEKIECVSKRLVVAHGDGVVSVWDSRTMSCVRTWDVGCGELLTCMHFNEQMISIGFSCGRVRVLHVGF